jgi:hypothetical protein
MKFDTNSENQNYPDASKGETILFFLHLFVYLKSVDMSILFG